MTARSRSKNSKQTPRHGKGRAISSVPAATYVPSPEHKTHPGPWGSPQWKKREPPLSPCPTDLDIHGPQAWLEEALTNPFCWDWADEEALGSDAHPPYLYWYDPVTDRFYVGQRLQRAWVDADAFSYKGYPVEDADVPRDMVKRFHEQGLLEDAVRDRLRRERRKRYGAKP